jgi:oligopeptide transport system permease protein
MLLALAAISLPAFIIGPVLILVFSLWLYWLPVGGWGSPSAILLPAITLAAPYVAYIARLLRGSMMETLGQDFIRTARKASLSASLPPCLARRHSPGVCFSVHWRPIC